MSGLRQGEEKERAVDEEEGKADKKKDTDAVGSKMLFFAVLPRFPLELFVTTHERSITAISGCTMGLRLDGFALSR